MESSLRDRIGESLRRHKILMLAAVVVAALLSALDTVIPPMGIPLAVLFIWLVLWLTRTGWSDLGLGRPKSWGKTLGIGIGTALALQAFTFWGLLPAMQHFGWELPDLSRFESMQGNLPMLLLFLAVSWTTAGFGEEIIWRGFVMTRGARILGGSMGAWILSLFLASAVFGLLHLYQGAVGVVLTGFAGFVLGVVYLVSGRNLWASIFAHGLTDTLSFLIIYFGWWARLT